MIRKSTSSGLPSLLIASDHAGFELKEFLKQSLSKKYVIVDLGPESDARTDYPDFAAKLSRRLQPLLHPKHGTPAKGVLICGSGIGMCISANKFRNIRAAVVESTKTAKLSKEHNDANVLCVGSRIVSKAKAKQIILAWLSAKFEGGRHLKRVQKIARLG
ncbi:MAG: ribose 5-phosphate isomerase B [Bacteriovoracia bacterium]